MTLGLSNADRLDTNEKVLQHAVVTVGTSAVELKGGASRDAYRQAIFIYNDSDSTVYLGGSGVTATGATRGIPLAKKQTATIPLGDQAIYAIAGDSGNDVIVLELG
jgi:hypothetical protein